MMNKRRAHSWAGGSVLVLGMAALLWGACMHSEAQAGSSKSSGAELIQPEELAAMVQSGNGRKPLILQVGFHVLFVQAHIPQSEYVGPTSQPEGMQRLRKRVEAVPRGQFIVLYCGCCPWSHCPNVNPAYTELRKMGFSKVKVLYIADNFGKDWVDKGYPTAQGE